MADCSWINETAERFEHGPGPASCAGASFGVYEHLLEGRGMERPPRGMVMLGDSIDRQIDRLLRRHAFTQVGGDLPYRLTRWDGIGVIRRWRICRGPL
jgi:hypothetical protein